MAADMEAERAGHRAWEGGGLRGGLVRGLVKKLAKMLAKAFPLNAVRVRALRLAAYQVEKIVYIGEELHVTDGLTEEYADTGVLLSIGDRVAIAQRVLIIVASHPNESRLRERVGTVVGKVTIGDDAWIGAGAIILPGVTIGERAIVGAGSVVTKDVAARTVVVGNPARVLRLLDEEAG